MKEFIKSEGIANRIRLKRSQHQGAFLIVEGDEDSRVFGHFLTASHCQIIIAHGKKNAVQALAALDAEQFAGVLAIVDTDFDRLEGHQPFSPNLHLTDTHDLETLILQSPAFEKVLAEFGSENKLAAFSSSQSDDIRSTLLKVGSHLGYLRWHSLRQKLNLKFESLTFSKFVDSSTLAIDAAKLVKTVKDHSSAHHLNETEIQEQVRQLQDNNHDLWLVCCGHDLVEILSIGLRKTLGSNDAKQVEPEILGRALRLAYEFAHFCVTKVYAAVQGWEQLNQPFQVFRR